MQIGQCVFLTLFIYYSSSLCMNSNSLYYTIRVPASVHIISINNTVAHKKEIRSINASSIFKNNNDPFKGEEKPFQNSYAITNPRQEQA